MRGACPPLGGDRDGHEGEQARVEDAFKATRVPHHICFISASACSSQNGMPGMNVVS
jgi:hypothetical protein